MFRDIQPFTLSFNQSTLKRQTVGPKLLYLYLFSLNLQLTFFCENTPLFLLYDFNCPSPVVFCLKQATQPVTTFTEVGVTRFDTSETKNAHLTSATKLQRWGPAELAQLGSSVPAAPRSRGSSCLTALSCLCKEPQSAGSQGLLSVPSVPVLMLKHLHSSPGVPWPSISATAHLPPRSKSLFPPSRHTIPLL